MALPIATIVITIIIITTMILKRFASRMSDSLSSCDFVASKAGKYGITMKVGIIVEVEIERIVVVAEPLIIDKIQIHFFSM